MIALLWIALGLLIISYIAYRWKLRRDVYKHPQVTFQTKQQGIGGASQRSSTYSFSGRSLSSPRDEIQYRASTQVATPTSPQHSFYGSPILAFPALEAQLRELASKAWATEKSLQQPQFLLNPADFININSPVQVVEILIRHAKRTTPGFNVPQLVPRVLVTSIPFAAGMFEVDEEGWVTIKVRSDFFQDKLAAQAILAHEVCHYILENSGIRKNNTESNEKYTDLCMFVCGFGEIFLAGYRRETAQQDYRPGHRLGYLTDDEYQFAQRYVLQLRKSGEVTPIGELEQLKQRLIHLLYDDIASCNRQIAAERKRYPHQSEVAIYQAVINRLERDRER